MSESAALQKMIYERLLAAPAVAAIVGTRIYDKPTADARAPYVSLGPSDYLPDDADCIDARIETVQIDCWSEANAGKREVKDLSDAVKKALHRFDGMLEAGALVSIEVTQVRVIDDPDGITLHGIVIAEAMIEEA